MAKHTAAAENRFLAELRRCASKQHGAFPWVKEERERKACTGGFLLNLGAMDLQCQPKWKLSVELETDAHQGFTILERVLIDNEKRPWKE